MFIVLAFTNLHVILLNIPSLPCLLFVFATSAHILFIVFHMDHGRFSPGSRRSASWIGISTCDNCKELFFFLFINLNWSGGSWVKFELAMKLFRDFCLLWVLKQPLYRMSLVYNLLGSFYTGGWMSPYSLQSYLC